MSHDRDKGRPKYLGGVSLWYNKETGRLENDYTIQCPLGRPPAPEGHCTVIGCPIHDPDTPFPYEPPAEER